MGCEGLARLSDHLADELSCSACELGSEAWGIGVVGASAECVGVRADMACCNPSRAVVMELISAHKFSILQRWDASCSFARSFSVSSAIICAATTSNGFCCGFCCCSGIFVMEVCRMETGGEDVIKGGQSDCTAVVDPAV